ncbi:YafY family protein [Psychromarinibacter sp. C21-152]|uniref:YafY family protein n=1 Tax=Psychromarinibacter sediminicola TaxID=3033385 RepID=A0AAE3TC88_9RHOB|nr:YafY family protein [Psychromarinibacter sediminicola]MDF0603400.1 YafY family protein [Psychromarinibacter sediminicola]
MRRADRLFRIVQSLRGGRLRTARQLADALEVSERTIYRDIADLQASGVPVEGASGYGYVMADGYELPPMMFSRDEVVALVAGARLIRAFGGLAMAQAAEEALVKIAAVLPEAERARAEAVKIHAIDTTGLDEATRALIDRLEAATDARERMDLAYRDAEGAETRRMVRPLGLGFWGKVWTLLAWCELRQDFRMFRLDRIAAAEAQGTFRPEKGRTLADYLARVSEEERHALSGR